ncbi:Hydroxyacylglutathione hydrolase GloC [Zhongshania aliphaticivorans]|uniref:Hydroxyacylglutathione hydrolase GloC n=1 Tax=Zhongshania aliphaticivorans TaxID=1470434 RepID=A0A5S9MZ40_9GAMM|nr:MBL fold metallo-hydrolase [Zhongshania aliphaticivorans]CAA0082665.1 Hydroxyacylglutathione hydrolase GloC [Zhongshania aliphaticivorans]CAA0084049.1 Hydroxyacylglutathione hydrolase GloC [Zhongshania aliphaticivorans]
MLVAGVLDTLLAGVHRIVAPNPSVMTGPGTNTYLLGNKRITVLDPGPAIPVHIEAIEAGVAQLGGVIERIVTTHTHPDHSPGAAALQARFKVPVIGAEIADDGHQDTSFAPTHGLSHDDCFDVDGGVLRAIHTPGHVGNHFCFFHEPSGTMFTGDHIMQGSTVVIIPPAGDMADYIASLRLLLNYPLKFLAPGHGTLIETPVEEVEGLIAHRQSREDKVWAALKDVQRGDLDALVRVAYQDVDEAIHPIAKLSLWAHLLKLEKESSAKQDNGQWELIS